MSEATHGREHPRSGTPTTPRLVIDPLDLVLLTDSIDLARQRLKQRLLTILGEWFLDESIGIPYFQEIFKKGVNESRVRSLFLSVIKNTENINKIEFFDLDFTESTRTLTVNFTVSLLSGETLTESLSL